MRIGIDITELYVAQAGVFNYRYKLILALAQLDRPEHEVVLVDYMPIHGNWREPAEIATLEACQVETRHIRGVRQRKLSRLWFLQKPGLFPAARFVDDVVLFPWAKLASWDKERKLQKGLEDLHVFHCSDVLNHSVPGTKTVTTVHDLTTLIYPEYHLAGTRQLQEQKFRFAQEEADAIIAVSENTKHDLAMLLQIEPERIHVVYEGVDPIFRPLPDEQVEQSLSRLGLQHGEYILHVGTIEPRKNLIRLVEAYHQLCQELPAPVPKLALAGATGWLFQELLDRIRELGLEESIVFLGKVEADELPALYNGAVVFTLPTLYEGFGLPALEAMACGTPVITSAVSSLPEVVGEAAVLIDPSDTQDLAAAIARLLADEQEREALAIAGQARAKHFSWESTARQTLQVYESILKQ